MLEAVELQAGVANLATRLTNVDGDALALVMGVKVKKLWKWKLKQTKTVKFEHQNSENKHGLRRTGEILRDHFQVRLRAWKGLSQFVQSLEKKKTSEFERNSSGRWMTGSMIFTIFWELIWEACIFDTKKTSPAIYLQKSFENAWHCLPWHVKSKVTTFAFISASSLLLHWIDLLSTNLSALS